jgi:calcineurin-like phosphoesterase family protein
MNKWITADWHLGETRFDIMQRPFRDVDEHCERIIANHNAVVTDDDIVYVVGDVIYQKADSVKYLPMVSRMKGTKILIRGNHDIPFTDEQFKPHFKGGIMGDGEGGNLLIDGVKCYATHYPSSGKKDAFNLVGHVHGAWKVQLNCLNVGIDVHHFYPVPFSNISFYVNAITNFYDNDVFAAYLDVNSDFRDTRGKKSSYLKK